jgi:hypothetical protein
MPPDRNHCHSAATPGFKEGVFARKRPLKANQVFDLMEVSILIGPKEPMAKGLFGTSNSS